MSKPILKKTTSIAALVKGQPWGFQPAATSGGPVAAWTAIGLPPGITVNTTTGRLSGTPTTPGVYNVTIKARDAASVFSDPLIFPVGVETLPFESDGAIRVNVKVQTGEVYLPDAGGQALFAKAGDKKLVAIGFEDGGILQDVPNMALVNVSLKVWDDDVDFLPLNDGNFIKSGDFNTTRYLVWLDFDTDKRIREAFDEFDNPLGTGFAGLAEIERTWFAWVPGASEPQQCQDTSRNFKVATYRDLNPTRRVATLPE